MTDYFLILLSTVLVNNIVLINFLGAGSFIRAPYPIKTALGVGLATALVLTLSSIVNYLLYQYILIPLDLSYLRTLIFILIILVIVQSTDMAIRKIKPALHDTLGIFLALITTNCAILGVTLLNIQQAQNFLQAAVYGFGAALGFLVVLVLFAAMHERLSVTDAPAPFKGAPLTLITVGIMSLAFLGFAGFIKT
ncbi:MAG: electron transport complex subunit RsxA [Gammaproteobacteria bacterium]|nr:electron transport complex subunit RsxA [Gammaproteobacteria bacterium]